MNDLLIIPAGGTVDGKINGIGFLSPASELAFQVPIKLIKSANLDWETSIIICVHGEQDGVRETTKLLQSNTKISVQEYVCTDGPLEKMSIIKMILDLRRLKKYDGLIVVGSLAICKEFPEILSKIMGYTKVVDTSELEIGKVLRYTFNEPTVDVISRFESSPT